MNLRPDFFDLLERHGSFPVPTMKGYFDAIGEAAPAITDIT